MTMLRKLFALLVLTFIALAKPAAATGVSVVSASTKQKQAARVEYKKGKAAKNAQQHERALKHFRASHAIVASPNSHMMIVLMLTKMRRLGEAYREAIATIAEAKEAVKVNRKYATALAAARAKVKQFETQVAFVNVVVAPQVIRNDTSLRIAGRTIPRERWSVPHAVTPGQVEVVLSGHPKHSLRVVAGRQYPVRFMTRAGAATTQSNSDTSVAAGGLGAPTKVLVPAIVVASAGGLSLILAGIFGAQAQGAFNDLEAKCINGQCPVDAQADIDRGTSLQTASNVTLVLGLVAVAAGGGLLAFHLFGPRKEGPKEGPAATTGPSARLVLGVGSGALKVRF